MMSRGRMMVAAVVVALVFAGLGQVATVEAANILWVTDNNAGDNTFTDHLAALGHTVDIRDNAGGTGMRTLDAAKIAALDAADLVIVSRQADSG